MPSLIFNGKTETQNIFYMLFFRWQIFSGWYEILLVFLLLAKSNCENSKQKNQWNLNIVRPWKEKLFSNPINIACRKCAIEWNIACKCPYKCSKFPKKIQTIEFVLCLKQTWFSAVGGLIRIIYQSMWAKIVFLRQTSPKSANFAKSTLHLNSIFMMLTFLIRLKIKKFIMRCKYMWELLQFCLTQLLTNRMNARNSHG